jgi:hypothetical protein
MIVTPEGSIIRNGGPELKPETDPGWEERKAERKAKKARLISPGSTSTPHGSPEESDDDDLPSPHSDWVQRYR